MTQSKTIGNIIKSKRESLGLSHSQITDELKIKEKYLRFIEEDNFASFYSKAQAKGFLRNYARLLNLNDEQLIAMYRRDVENLDMKRKITLIEDEEEEEEKEPTKFEVYRQRINEIKITRKRIAASLAIIVIFFLGLNLFQTLQQTFDKPDLEIYSPFELQAPFDGTLAFDKNSIIISGKTEEGVNISINGNPLFLNPLFEFTSDIIPTVEDDIPIVIKAENSLGATSEITIRLNKDSIKFNEIDASVQIIDSNTVLLVKADGAIIFDQIGQVGDSFPVEANNALSIEAANPESVVLQINGDIYALEDGLNLYKLEEGTIVKE